MSTIEAGRPVPPSQTPVSLGHDAAAAFDAASSTSPSLPDPQVLTRLANEMFSSFPGAGPLASGVSAAEAVAAPAQSLGPVVPSADTSAQGTAAPCPPFAGASLPVTSPPTMPLP